MEYNAKEIGGRIQSLRKEHNITQEQLAEELHISAVYVSKIEHGTRNCSLNILILLSELFGVSLDYLILGKTPSTVWIKQALQGIQANLDLVLDNL